MTEPSLPDRNTERTAAVAVPWVAGVILAGGRSQRMGGGDKSLMLLAGIPLAAHALTRLGSQVRPLAISANGDPSRFAWSGIPVLPDAIAGFVGPLAGILTGMLWARGSAPNATHILTAAADTPFLPVDLGARLAAAIEGDVTIAVASSRGRLHHVFALWPVALAESLLQWLEAGRDRAVHSWLTQHRFSTVDFEGAAEGPFFNINTPADLETARRVAEGNPL